MTHEAIEKFFFLTFEINSSPSDIMQKAFVSLQKRRFKPRWIDYNVMKSISESLSLDAAIFIITERFDDEIIEFFKDKFRIIGPLIITYCDKDMCTNPQSTLPKRPWPIYSQCMRGLVITTSDLPAKKRNLVETRVQMMSGKYHKDLNGDTNVIVSNSVLTRKARAAGQYRVPMVTYEWIESCWQQYQHEHRYAIDQDILSKYKLPIFYGLNIVITGILDRDIIINNIESNGGTYCPMLKIRPITPNTILLVADTNGEKYKYAKRLNIPCLRPEWIEESIKAEYALPFDDFLIKGENDTTNNNNATSTTTTNHASSSQPLSMDKINGDDDEQNELEPILKEIIESNNTNNDMHIFDGNSIHALGFNDRLLTLIRNCAKKFGAFFYNSLCDSVTNVIVGKKITSSSLEQLLNSDYADRLVTIDWLINCINSNELCSQIDYHIDSFEQLKTMKYSISNRSNMIKELNIDAVDDALQRSHDETATNKNTLKRQLISQENDESDNDSPDFEYTVIGNDTPLPNSLQTTFNDVTNDDDDGINTNNSRKRLKINNEKSAVLTLNDNLIEMKNESITLMFSSFDDDYKNRLIQLSKAILNVSIIDESSLSTKVTHLILNQPRRSEKVFAAIAAGIFILKPEFIFDSIKSKKLLPEHDYQWGIIDSPQSTENDSNELTENRLMQVAIEWRKHIEQNGQRKIFQDFKILLLHTDSILNSWANVLRSGGAKIFSIDDILGQSDLNGLIDDIDYAIINPNFNEKPRMTREKFMKLIDFCYENDTLTNYCIVSRYIFQGPQQANFDELRKKYSITNEDIRNYLSKFY